MRVKRAHKKSAQRSIIYLTFLLLFSLPIIIFGLAQDDFDIRRRAFDDLELSKDNPCLISLPNVNPYTLEVNKTVTIQVDAKLEEEGIAQLQVFDSNGETVYQEQFQGSPVSDSKDTLCTYSVVDWKANPYKENIPGFGNVSPV